MSMAMIEAVDFSSPSFCACVSMMIVSFLWDTSAVMRCTVISSVYVVFSTTFSRLCSKFSVRFSFDHVFDCEPFSFFCAVFLLENSVADKITVVSAVGVLS